MSRECEVFGERRDHLSMISEKEKEKEKKERRYTAGPESVL